MNMKPILLTIAMMAGAAWTHAQVNINIDAQQRGPAISPTHYGIFYEDINHAADGGIYAELIRNRSFEDGPRFGAPADMQGWTTEATETGIIKAQLIQPSKSTPLLNAVQHNALELTIKATMQDPVFLVNKGFWGINAVQGRTYRLSFWAKAPKYQGTVQAMLRNEAGDECLAEVQIPLDPKAKGWKKYTMQTITIKNLK